MSPYRVLIMERDARVSRVLSRIVRKMGHDPYTAGDYEHFKRLYAQTNPDLILLSLDSDDSDAVNAEFLRFLVGEKTGATVCLLGGADDDHFASLALLGQSARLKMGGIIQKPLDMDSLKTRLDELMLASPHFAQKKSLAADKARRTKMNRDSMKATEFVGFEIKNSGFGRMAMKTVNNRNRVSGVLGGIGNSLFAAFCALGVSAALPAAEIDWTKVETKTIKTFYPGVASWDFMREQEHGTGAAPVKTLKKACVDCHVGENDAYDIKADEIIAGTHQMSKSKTPLEPEPIAGAKGFLEVKAQVAYDAEQIHLRFQWAGSGASVTDPALATDDKIDRISVQLANKIQSFNNYGCYITCHNDQEGMPDDRGGKTKLYTYYSRGKDGLQAKDKLDGYKANGQFIDLWEAGFVGNEVKAEDMYVLEDRIEDNNDLTATGGYENGTYTVVISRKLATGDAGDVALADGAAFTIGIAIHDNKNTGRKHYTSFPHAVGLGAAAEINAQKF